ncbi:hypothetical protein B296_00042960 [Ensete ventricosum]|uniref:Uncharacterized protein n=1 Tax=Ensete ventricosum TaxID=4639 RepID=A0A426ZGI7_ENSVE|nr:hypothetical protein B296_00042960 [Ensete ventricosum]
MTGPKRGKAKQERETTGPQKKRTKSKSNTCRSTPAARAGVLRYQKDELNRPHPAYVRMSIYDLLSVGTAAAQLQQRLQEEEGGERWDGWKRKPPMWRTTSQMSLPTLSNHKTVSDTSINLIRSSPHSHSHSHTHPPSAALLPGFAPTSGTDVVVRLARADCDISHAGRLYVGSSKGHG